MAVMGVAKFERFFRSAAGVTVDKDDLKRYSDFVNSKLHDLLLIGEATAKANLRDIVEPWDLPVTKGLQETLHVFKKMDEEIELAPILEHLGRPATARPGNQCRDRGQVAGGRRRPQCGVGPDVQGHRPCA